jgi:hypothetical protein
MVPGPHDLTFRQRGRLRLCLCWSCGRLGIGTQGGDGLIAGRWLGGRPEVTPASGWPPALLGLGSRLVGLGVVIVL